MTCTRCKKRPHSARGLCDACYITYRERQVAYGRWESLYVDAAPTRERIQALRDRGFGFKRIAGLSGVSKDVLRGIAVGRGGYPPVKKVHRRTETRVLAVPLPLMRDAYKLMAPTARVDVTGTRRRLRALMAIGYPQNYTAGLISPSVWGNRRLWTDEGDYTLASIAARVVEIFDELQLTHGPSDRARRWAAKQGWALPLQWDEDTIDDPAAEPYTGKVRQVPFVERYCELRDLGYSDVRIAEKMGQPLESVERQLYRHGMRPRRVTNSADRAAS